MQENEYMTLNEAAEYTGIKRGSLPYQIKRLGIKTERFPLSKHTYITRRDADRIKLAREKPWMIEEKSKENAA